MAAISEEEKEFIFQNNMRQTIQEIIIIIIMASSFEEGCQKGQKAINADHLYICFLIINWINPDRQRQMNR